MRNLRLDVKFVRMEQRDRVGLDQQDNDGLVTDFRTTNPEDQARSNLVFISREREARLAITPPQEEP